MRHMRRKTPGLTGAEWNLMECLWEKSPRTGREVVEDMQLRQNWNRSTTLTMLRRMTEKEQIRCEESEGVRMYVPMICREDALLEETDSFLKRAYSGSVSLLVNTLTRHQELSREEIEELYDILRKAEQKGDA